MRSNGYIITNAHVIENADEITVTLLDDRQIKAEDRRHRQAGSDVALLKVTTNNLVEMPLADPSKAEVGDFVLAIGNPFALQPHGDLRHHQRARPLGRQAGFGYQDFIQTDASDQSRQLRRRARRPATASSSASTPRSSPAAAATSASASRSRRTWSRR